MLWYILIIGIVVYVIYIVSLMLRMKEPTMRSIELDGEIAKIWTDKSLYSKQVPNVRIDGCDFEFRKTHLLALAEIGELPESKQIISDDLDESVRLWNIRWGYEEEKLKINRKFRKVFPGPFEISYNPEKHG